MMTELWAVGTWGQFGRCWLHGLDDTSIAIARNTLPTPYVAMFPPLTRASRVIDRDRATVLYI